MSGVIFYLTILAASTSAVCWAKPAELFTQVPTEYPQGIKWVSHREGKAADLASRVPQVKHSAEVPNSRSQKQLNLDHINAEVSGDVPADADSALNYADVVVNSQLQGNENPAQDMIQIAHNTQDNASPKRFSMIENELRNRVNGVEQISKISDSTISFNAPIEANLLNSVKTIKEQVNNPVSVLNPIQSVSVPENNIASSASDTSTLGDHNSVRISNDSIVFSSDNDPSTFLHAEVPSVINIDSIKGSILTTTTVSAALPDNELVDPVEISLNNQEKDHSNFVRVQLVIPESKSTISVNVVPESNVYLSPAPNTIGKIPNYGGIHFSDQDTEIIESLPPIYHDNETEVIDTYPQAEEHPQYNDYYPPEQPQYDYNMTQPQEPQQPLPQYDYDVQPQPEEPQQPQHDYDLQFHPEEQQQPQYDYDTQDQPQQPQYDYDSQPPPQEGQQPQCDYDVQPQQKEQQPQYDYEIQNQPQQPQYDYDAHPQPEEAQQPQHDYDVQSQPEVPDQPQYDYDVQPQQGQQQPQYDYDTQNQHLPMSKSSPSYEHDTHSQHEEPQQRQYSDNVQPQQPQFYHNTPDRSYLPSLKIAKSLRVS